ncbi:hypothetical protein P4313_28565, partial [Bacillus tropicus]|nr:hypothetical protein [Bacillus tropicus]
MSIDEQKLMIQYTNIMSKGLDNHYADKSSYKEANKFEEMLKNFPPKQIGSGAKIVGYEKGKKISNGIGFYAVKPKISLIRYI